MKEEQFSKINKLWKLLKVALDDLEKVNKDPYYALNMRIWHRASRTVSPGVCYVCMGGAIMAKSFNINSGYECAPSEFKSSIKRRLYAIEQIRSGALVSAMEEAGFRMSKRDESILYTIKQSLKGVHFVRIEEENFRDFKKSMKFYRRLQGLLFSLNY